MNSEIIKQTGRFHMVLSVSHWCCRFRYPVVVGRFRMVSVSVSRRAEALNNTKQGSRTGLTIMVSTYGRHGGKDSRVDQKMERRKDVIAFCPWTGIVCTTRDAITQRRKAKSETRYSFP